MADLVVPIKHKKSSMVGAIPDATQIAEAEIAINLVDRKAYTKGGTTVFQLGPSMAEHNLKAPLASPTFTGTPVAPTPSPGDNSTKIATTAFVQNATSTATVSQEAINAGLLTTNGGVTGTTAINSWIGYAALNGWTATRGDKSQIDASTLRITANAANPFLALSGLSIDGTRQRYVAFRYRRITGSHEGRLYYTTGGHSYSDSYYGSWLDPGETNWKTVVLDMWNPAVGGTDWKTNTITALRLDVSGDATSVWEIAWIMPCDEYPFVGVPALAASMPLTFTPEQFGAVGDGVTDDGAALQKLFTALPTRGAMVELRGLYRTTQRISIVAKSFTCQGLVNYAPTNATRNRSTGFVLSGNSDIYCDNVNGSNWNNVCWYADSDKGSSAPASKYLLYLTNCAKMTWRDCSMDGNDVAGVCLLRAGEDSNGLRFDGFAGAGATGSEAFLFENVSTLECNNFNLGSDHATDLIVMNGADSAKFTNFALVFGRRSINCTNVGFLYMAAGGFENSYGTPIYIEDGAVISLVGLYFSTDSLNVDYTAEPNDINNIYISSKVNDVRISSCVIRGARDHGIYVAGYQTEITGNYITRNSARTPNTKSGIYIASTAKKVTITGNTISDEHRWDDGTNALINPGALQKYAIENYAPANQVVIVGNHLSNNVSGAIGGSVTTGTGITANLT